jgi:hypothetical protein
VTDVLPQFAPRDDAQAQLTSLLTALHVSTYSDALSKIAAYHMLVFNIRRAWETYSGEPGKAPPPAWLTALVVAADSAERVGMPEEAPPTP